MPIKKHPALERLRALERERDKVQKWLDDDEYVNRGRLERQLYRLNGQIERQENKVSRLRGSRTSGKF